MKKKLSLCVCCFCVMLTYAQTVHLPAPFAPQTVKAFADSLFSTGFFDEAEGEYKRYLFSADTVDITAILPLATIYNQKNNKDGILWLKQSFYDAVPVPVQEKLNLVHGRFLFLERNAEAFGTFAQSISLPVFSTDFQQTVTLSQQILDRQIDQAAQTAQAAAQLNAVFAPTAEALQAYHPKSAALAVFLSCLVPGLGKWYGGTFGGFTTDFLSVGATTAAAIYTGIDTKWKHWRPYVFGTMAVSLFVVDLYGTYKNIQRYNAAQYRALCEEADTIYAQLY